MIRRLGGVAAASLIGLAACVPGVIQDPNYFWFVAHDGLALGDYNPETFTADEVEAAVAFTCATRAVDKFSDKINSEGVMVFAARCADGGQIRAGRYEFDKKRDGRLVQSYTP